MAIFQVTPVRSNGTVPTRSEFEAWTIKQRHNYIREQFGNLKRRPKGLWFYLQNTKLGYGVRFMLNRRHEISHLEIHGIDECMKLMEQTRLSSGAFAYNRNN
jgi:hypothetical protein